MLFRILSSAVVVPAFLWALFRQPVGFRLFLVACFLLAFEEYRRLMAQKGWRFSPWLGLAALLAMLLPPALGPGALSGGPAEWLLARSGSVGLAAFFMAAALWRVTHADLEAGVQRFFAELGGVVYIGVLGLHVVKLHAFGAYGPWWCFLVVWYAWVYDSGALFAGKTFGRTPFSPLSPSKTWEGFWGGMLVSAALSGLLLPRFFPAGFPLDGAALALLSVPASALGQAGDLFESMVKRFAGAKDSSHLIASHGGFLDKVDSSLFVGPLVYLAAVWLGA